jgi:demethylmenaquinone methyltransferase/2-methoxy-6-polyprenyl-1,4-benzoquinol methylase
VNMWNHKRKNMHRYDLTAKMYEMRYAEEQEVKYKAALKSLNVSCSSRVLDVGCGTGLFFRHIFTDVQSVVGVDVSAKLLRQAKERVRVLNNVHLVQADADNLPFTDSYFDLVFAFTLLQNMPNPLKTLNEIKRNTKVGGFLVLTGLKKFFSLESFTVLLENAGLTLVSIENADDLKCYIATTVRN